MSRAIGPRAPFAAGNAASAWIVLSGCWALVAVERAGLGRGADRWLR